MVDFVNNYFQCFDDGWREQQGVAKKWDLPFVQKQQKMPELIYGFLVFKLAFTLDNTINNMLKYIAVKVFVTDGWRKKPHGSKNRE